MSTDASVETPVVSDDAGSLLERLGMLRDACSTALSVNELMAVAVAQARAATCAAGGVLFLLDGDELTVAASSGYPAELMAQWSRFALSADTPAGRAARERRPQWLSDPAEKTRRHPALAPERTGYRALAALPIECGESVLGVLGISFRDARVFSPPERLFLLLLAEQVGVTLGRIRDAGTGADAIDRARVADPVRRQTVTEVLAVIDASRTTVIRSIFAARTFCGVDSAQFSLIGEEQLVLGGSGATPAIGTVSPADESLCTVTMSLRSPLIVPDAPSDDRVAALAPVRSGGVRAYLGVPVSVAGMPVGALCVYDAQPRPWSVHQREFLETLAEAVGAELTLRILLERDARLLRTAETHLHLLDRLAAAESLHQAASVLLEAAAGVDGAAGAALAVLDAQATIRYEQALCSSQEAGVALGVLAAREPVRNGPGAHLLELNDLIDILLGDVAHLVEIGARRVVQVSVAGRTTTGSLVVALSEPADAERVRRELVGLAQFGGAVLDGRPPTIGIS
jgi:GAF domain-containing protein